jgi:signal transduction histidine kinase
MFTAEAARLADDAGMSERASSVTHGDLSHEMTTKSRGEISQMETNVNLLVNDLREKEDTKRWLEANLSRLNILEDLDSLRSNSKNDQQR